MYDRAQIAAQCGVALVLGTWGVLRLQGNFLPIRTTEVLGQQYAHRALERMPPDGLCCCRRCLAARCSCDDDTPPVRLRLSTGRRTMDNLEPGPDFQHFNTRELR